MNHTLKKFLTIFNIVVSLILVFVLLYLILTFPSPYKPPSSIGNTSKGFGHTFVGNNFYSGPLIKTISTSPTKSVTIGEQIPSSVDMSENAVTEPYIIYFANIQRDSNSDPNLWSLTANIYPLDSVVMTFILEHLTNMVSKIEKTYKSWTPASTQLLMTLDELNTYYSQGFSSMTNINNNFLTLYVAGSTAGTFQIVSFDSASLSYTIDNTSTTASGMALMTKKPALTETSVLVDNGQILIIPVALDPPGINDQAKQTPVPPNLENVVNKSDPYLYIGIVSHSLMQYSIA